MTKLEGRDLQSIRELYENVAILQAEGRVAAAKFELAVREAMATRGIFADAHSICLQCGSVHAKDTDHECAREVVIDGE